MKSEDPLIAETLSVSDKPVHGIVPLPEIPKTGLHVSIRDRLRAILGVRLAHIALVLLGVSALACSIVVFQTVVGGRHRQSYLIFNLFLAWVPFLFAWLCTQLAATGKIRTLSFWAFAFCWLLFLPNAPYLFTDLVHLLGRSLPSYWPDMMKILLFALTGFTVGMVSLEMMHEIVRRMFGWVAGWTFVAMVSGLCSVGVSLGRFHRWNSWDALNDPTGIVRDAVNISTSPWIMSTTGQFVMMLAILIFCGYCMIHALGGTLRNDDRSGADCWRSCPEEP
jgi:uncharacterized membrane protein